MLRFFIKRAKKIWWCLDHNTIVNTLNTQYPKTPPHNTLLTFLAAGARLKAPNALPPKPFPPAPLQCAFKTANASGDKLLRWLNVIFVWWNFWGWRGGWGNLEKEKEEEEVVELEVDLVGVLLLLFIAAVVDLLLGVLSARIPAIPPVLELCWGKMG